MRTDKYLKVARVIKRRTIAKELADDNRIFINDKIAKPSSEIEVGDIVDIKFEHRHIKIEVTHVFDKILKSNPAMYNVISDVRVDRPKDENQEITHTV